MTASTPRRRRPRRGRPGSRRRRWRHHDVPCVDQRADRRRVEDLERLRRRDHAPPALLAAVLPGLAVLDQQLRASSSGEVAADRLGRVRERRVVGVHQGPGDQRRRVRRSTPRRRAPRRARSSARSPSVAWVCAPHQSSGTGGTTAAASSFFTSRLPTCGPLPWVSTTSCPLRRGRRPAACPPAAAIWSSGRAARQPGHGVAAQGDDDAHGADPGRRRGRRAWATPDNHPGQGRQHLPSTPPASPPLAVTRSYRRSTRCMRLGNRR